MERIRESRRGTASVSGSFSSSRRRSRGSAYRESSGAGEIEDGGNDLLRDRSKKERPSRRRRVNSNESFHVDRDEGGDGSSDESLDEDHDDEDEPMRGGGGGGGGGGNSSLRRTSRGKTQWKGSDEVIGVSVPRKARSVSAKRLQDSISAVRPSSSSSPARTATSVSPPSSNASMKASKRVKPVTVKTKPPKISKVSISESEVEVAQVLYGLTRLQSHSPPAKPQIVQSSSPLKLDFKHNSANEGSLSVASKASSPVSTPISPPSSSHQMVLPQHSSSTHATTVMAPKRKKPRVVKPEGTQGSGNHAIMGACSSKPSESLLPGNSISPVAANPTMKVETEREHQDAKAEIMSPKSDNNTEPNNSGSYKAETSIPKDTPQSEEKLSSLETNSAMSTEMMLHPTSIPNTEENRAIDADRKSSMDQNHQTTQKELSFSTQDFPSPLTTDVKLEALKMPSIVSTTTKREKGPKYEIDLMAPPENCCPDECMPDATDRSAYHEPSPIIVEVAMKNKRFCNLSEKNREELRVKQDCRILDSEGKVHMKESAEEKQSVNDKKTESGHDGSPFDKAGNKQHSQKISKSTARQMERTVPPTGIMTSTSTPIPVPIPGWPGGIPPFGYLGSSPANFSGLSSFQGAKPVEGNPASAIPNPPFVMLHPRPKRCATHLFIAHLIRYQQQLQRPFWHAAGSAALYGARPYNMNILPPSDALLLGSSVIGNPNLSANNNLGSGSLITSNGHNLKEKAPNTHADAHRKQYMPTQTAPQGAAFIFPFVQPRTGETKSSALADNSALLSAPAAVSASMSTKFSNIATASDPQYMTMLPGNYPFPIPPSYRSHMNPQQQLATPFFGGSFYPSQVMQLQPQSLSQAQIPTTSTRSLSSQKHLQPQQCLPTSTMAESLRIEPESVGNNEVPLSQKKLQVQTLPANFPPNFPIMAPALGGKQQPPSDSSLQMSLKAIEVSRPVPPGHTMLQTMHDIGHNHYQLGHHLQVQTANLSKAPAKATSSAKGNDKSPESQSTALAVQQLQQKQVMAQTKQSIPALSTTAAMGGTAYPDRIPVVYSSAGSNLAGGSMGFPTMQCPPQWKMPSSQRMVQAGPSSNAIVQPAVVVAPVTPAPSAGSPSGKGTKLPSSPVNSSRRAIHTGSPILAQSSQAQSLGKAQQLFSNSEPVHQVGSTAMSHKRHVETNLTTQPMFPGSLNMKRHTNQQSQQGSPVLSAAGASSFLVNGGGKGTAVYNPLGGSPVTVMTGPSYVKSSNLPVKSAEQKPATA